LQKAQRHKEADGAESMEKLQIEETSGHLHEAAAILCRERTTNSKDSTNSTTSFMAETALQKVLHARFHQAPFHLPTKLVILVKDGDTLEL